MLPNMDATQRWVEQLATHLTLGEVLGALSEECAPELVAHWTQGEFHHDVVFRLSRPEGWLVVATNCNGGVKEVLWFEGSVAIEADALWHRRCPDNEEFDPAPLPPLLGEARTVHWFDPCELLAPDARSEMRPEHRERQRGGGWKPRGQPPSDACGVAGKK
jgi:hypothetical protein